MEENPEFDLYITEGLARYSNYTSLEENDENTERISWYLRLQLVIFHFFILSIVYAVQKVFIFQRLLILRIVKKMHTFSSELAQQAVCDLSTPSSSRLRTGRVLGQETVEDTWGPSSNSAIFSCDTAKFLARYGVVCGKLERHEFCFIYPHFRKYKTMLVI